MKFIVSKITFLLWIIFTTQLYIQVQSTSIVNSTYANNCIGCLNNGNTNFCSATNSQYYTAGVCCQGMSFSTDYCNAGYPYCTWTAASGGAKYNFCSMSSACGQNLVFYIIAGQTSYSDIIISSPGVCIYTIYYVLSNPSLNQAQADWPTQQSKSSTLQTAPFNLVQNATTYSTPLLFFTNDTAGNFFNLSLSSTYDVTYGQAYYLIVATNGLVSPATTGFTLKLGSTSSTAAAIGSTKSSYGQHIKVIISNLLILSLGIFATII